LTYFAIFLGFHPLCLWPRHDLGGQSGTLGVVSAVSNWEMQLQQIGQQQTFNQATTTITNKVQRGQSRAMAMAMASMSMGPWVHGMRVASSPVAPLGHVLPNVNSYWPRWVEGGAAFGLLGGNKQIH